MFDGPALDIESVLSRYELVDQNKEVQIIHYSQDAGCVLAQIRVAERPAEGRRFYGEYPD